MRNLTIERKALTNFQNSSSITYNEGNKVIINQIDIIQEIL